MEHPLDTPRHSYVGGLLAFQFPPNRYNDPSFFCYFVQEFEVIVFISIAILERDISVSLFKLIRRDRYTRL